MVQCNEMKLFTGADVGEQETLVEDEDVTAEKQRAEQASGTSEVGVSIKLSEGMGYVQKGRSVYGRIDTMQRKMIIMIIVLFKGYTI